MAAAILSAATLLDAGWLFLAFAVVAMVWTANLYTFMDGTDVMAGSMGLFGFGAYAVAAAVAGRAESGVLFGTLSAACAGFLVFNRPPARLFMGDVGAVGLGFLAGLFGLEGIVAGAWPWWFPPWSLRRSSSTPQPLYCGGCGNARRWPAHTGITSTNGPSSSMARMVQPSAPTLAGWQAAPSWRWRG